MKKIISVIVTILIFALSTVNISAAQNPDVLRVYKKIKTNNAFITVFNVTSENFEKYNITEEYVIEKMKDFIAEVINKALTQKQSGTLNKDNMKEQIKKIVMESIMGVDNKLFNMILDSMTEDELNGVFSGKYPERFNSLYSDLNDEIYYILGYNERPVDTIFDDLTGFEWATVAVDKLFNAGIVNGMSDFEFAPGHNVTREQFVKLLCEAFKIENGNEAVSFLDVKDDEWYYPYIYKMASNSLINGIENEKFGIGDMITRQDMAVMMFRVGESLGYFSSQPPKNPFSDSNYISEYAVNSVNSLRNNGVVNGDNNNMFNPVSYATRAEAVQMIYNMYKIN